MTDLIDPNSKQKKTECLVGYPIKIVEIESNLIVGYTNLVVVIVGFILALLSNVLLIFGMWKTNQKLKISQKLFIYLSIIGIISNTNHFVRTWIQVFIDADSYFLTVQLLDYNSVTFSLSVLIFTIISYIRYFTIKHPIHPTSGGKVFGLVVAASLCRVFMIVFTTIDYSHFFIKTLLIVVEFLVLVLMYANVVLNVKSFLGLRQRTHRNQPNAISTPNQRSQARKRRSVLTLLIITFVYFITSLPLFVLEFQNLVKPPSRLLNFSLLELGVTLWLLNTGINSTVYIRRTKKLRHYYHRLFCTRGIVVEPQP